MEDNFERMLALDDVSLPHSLRRSVWLIGDEEDGNNYTADEILDDKPQDIIFNMRATLTAAYKSGESKYVCPFCGQPVGLRVRTSKGDFFPFFSHYQDSDDNCPIKTINDVDPTRIIISSENLFRESVLHQDMVSKLKEILELSADFKEIEANKVISNPEVKGYRRPSLYSRYHDDNIICFDALLSNPQIGLLVGRNAFYKMQKMFYLWVFPDFSVQYQRMCEKDILYMNRRNVFVFDSRDYYNNTNNRKYLGSLDPNRKFAYEESIRQQRLMLNCYWQVPVLDEKKNVSITWKGPELVPFDEIVLDNNNYESYYHDSDQDFYHSYSPEKQRIIDDWMRIKEDRWRKIFDSIEKRKLLYEQALARRERRERLAYYYPLIESGEITPEPYKDERNGLWGYRIGDLDVIVPTYYDAHPFYSGFAWVRKKEKWGVINFKGEKICNFEYNDIRDLKDGLFSVYDNRFRNLVDYKGEEIKRGFDSITQFSNGRAKAQKNNKWGLIDEKGNEVYEIIQFSNGLKMYHSLYRERYGLFSDSPNNECEFIYDAVVDLNNGQIKALMDNNWGILDNKGDEVCDITPIGDGFYKYYSRLYGAYGIMTNDKKITSRESSAVKEIFEFDDIKDFSDGRAWALKSGKWGVIDIKGETVLDFQYNKLGDFVYNISVVCQKNEKWENYKKWNSYQRRYVNRSHSVTHERWGLVNKKGDILIPLSDSRIFIEGVVQNMILVRKGGFCGAFDNNNNIVIPLSYDGIEILPNGKVKAKKNYKYGLIGLEGKTLIPFEYDELKEFSDNIYTVCQTNKWGLVNTQGQIILPVEYDKIGDLEDGKAVVEKNGKVDIINNAGSILAPEPLDDYVYTTLSNGMIKYNYHNQKKYGLMNSNKTVLTDMVFDEIEDFCDGYAMATRLGQRGYIDELGEEVYDSKLLNNGYIREFSNFNKKYRLKDSDNKIVVDFIYDYIGDFSCDHARVKKNSDGWGVINQQGFETVPCKYSEIGIILDGKMIVRDGSSCGIIDVNNRIVVPIEYDELGEYQKGKIKACLSYKWGFVDGEGDRGISFKYDSVHDFSEGKAVCEIEGMYGVINERGRILIPFEYNDIKDFINGIAIAENADEKWGAFDENARTVVPFEFDEICSFQDGRARAKKGEQWGFINTQGETLIPFEYDELEDFVDGKAQALKFTSVKNYAYENWGYINERGEEIIEYRSLSNGLTVEICPLQGKQRFMNSNGEYISNQNYTDMEDFVDGKLICAKGYKWGVIDENFQEYIPFVYDKITYLGQNRFEVTEEIKQRWGGKKYKKEILPKELEKDETDTHGQMNMQNTIYDGVVDGKAPFGLFVRVPNVGKGLIRRNNIIKSGKGINDFKKGDKVQVIVLKINNDNGRVYYGLS